MDRATHAACDDVAVQINCWHSTGAGGRRDVVRLRHLPRDEVAALRAGIRAARQTDGSGEGGGAADDVVYVLERGFSPAQRAVARLCVGVGVAVGLVGAVVAVAAPSSAVIGVATAAVVVALVAALFGVELDSGVTIRRDGRLRREGWGGVREWDLRSYARVTVAPRLRPGAFEGPGP